MHVMSAKPFSHMYATNNVDAKFLTSTLHNYVCKKVLNLSIKPKVARPVSHLVVVDPPPFPRT